MAVKKVNVPEKRPGRIYSLRTKFTLITIGVISILFLIQMFANYYFAPEFYNLKKEKVMNKAFLELKEAAQVSEASYMRIIKRYEDQENLRFKTKNEDTEFAYRTQYTWNLNAVLEPVDIDDIKIQYSQYVKEPEAGVFENRRGKKNIRLRGFIDTDEGRYYVQILTSPKAVKAILMVMNQFSFFLFLVSCVLIGGLVYIYMKKIVTPIMKMSRVAVHIANQDFSVSIPVSKGENLDELGILAENMNKISEQLKADMEQLKEKNRELEEEIAYKTKMERIQREFVSNVSHELKTPIAVLSSYAQMLKYEKESIDADFYYDIILEETDMMGEKIGKLLELSSMEFGLEKMPKEVLDFGEVLARQLEISKVLFAQADICLESSLECCRVMGNRTYLESIINNYLSNARKHSPKHGTVRVSLRKEQNQVIFVVSNEGPHIPEEDIEHIWESFYQVDKSHNHNADKGVGLGLYIVKKIVDIHGGTYGMRNKKRGVEFYIQLPMIQERA